MIILTVRSLQDQPKGYGVIYGLTTTKAYMATSVPLTVGETFRFRLVIHDPPRTAERVGKVVREESILNLADHLVSECRVSWLSDSGDSGAFDREGRQEA